MSGSSLMASLMVSTIGYAVFLFGKRERRAPQLMGGLVLMVFPYFVDSALLMLVIAAALLLGLWLAVRLGW